MGLIKEAFIEKWCLRFRMPSTWAPCSRPPRQSLAFLFQSQEFGRNTLGSWSNKWLNPQTGYGAEHPVLELGCISELWKKWHVIPWYCKAHTQKYDVSRQIKLPGFWGEIKIECWSMTSVNYADKWSGCILGRRMPCSKAQWNTHLWQTTCKWDCQNICCVLRVSARDYIYKDKIIDCFSSKELRRYSSVMESHWKTSEGLAWLYHCKSCKADGLEVMIIGREIC